ncbi:MAG: hypothetical protein ACOYXC_02805 [Candidatus Rifleibacteriota bacterium]
MRKTTVKTLVAMMILAFTGLAGAQEAKKIDESIEPPAMFVVEINGGIKSTIKAGEAATISGEFKDPSVKVSVEPYKEFNYAGITLKYPQNFSFDADLADENVKMWNLSGTSGILMIQKYIMDMDHKTMANLLQPRYGEENARVSPCSMTVDGMEVPGTKVIATFGGTSISQEVYSFKQNDGSLLLIIQDSIDAAGKNTQEGLDLKELIGKTFKLK